MRLYFDLNNFLQINSKGSDGLNINDLNGHKKYCYFPKPNDKRYREYARAKKRIEIEKRWSANIEDYEDQIETLIEDDHEKLMQIYNGYFNDGQSESNKLEWIENIPLLNNNTNIPSIKSLNRDELMSIYFTDNEQIFHKFIHHQDKSVAVGDLYNEKRTLDIILSSPLKCEIGNIKEFPLRFNKALYQNLNSSTFWDKITENISHISDMIILDPFLFNSKDEIKKKDYNLKKLLKNIANKIPNSIKLLIVTNEIKLTKDDPDFKADQSLELQRKLYYELQDFINENRQVENKITISILSGYRSEHDRYMITNYGMMTIGSGFNLFHNENTGKAKPTNIEYHSLKENGYLRLINTLIDELKNNLGDTTKKYSLIGDKKNLPFNIVCQE